MFTNSKINNNGFISDSRITKSKNSKTAINIKTSRSTIRRTAENLFGKCSDFGQIRCNEI